MINPYLFAERNLKVGLKDIDCYHINYANSKLTITPNYPEFGFEVRYINKIIKELLITYARLLNQYKFKYQTIFSARFDKKDEDNQVLDATELFNILIINHNLTESDLDKKYIRSPLEHQIQRQEMREFERRFDKIKSMIIYFYKTGEMNGRSYVIIPLRSSATLIVENDKKYCFLWSIFAYIHPCNNNHPNSVSKYRQKFNELNIDGFDFANGIKSSDVHDIEKSNSLSFNIFELNFCQDQYK